MNLENDFFRIDTDSDGVALLTIDVKDNAVNVFTEDFLRVFEETLPKLIDDEAVNGVVIASAKPVFHVGADLDMAQNMASRPAQELYDDIMRINAMFRLMETGGKPFAAAVNGHALGGGFELALACHARVVADDSKLQLGLPEVKVGLMPGFGGTQRLARMVPLMEALPVMAQGVSLKPQKAKALGVVTDMVPAGSVVAAARKWILDNPKAAQPWDVKGFKAPAGKVHSPANVQLFAGAIGQGRKATYGNYPSPAAILEAVYHGLQMPIDQGLKVEARKFVSIAHSQVARSMIKTLFFGMNDANALKRRPAGPAKCDFKKIGLVGAGLMGAGIAYQAARAGIDVVLLDRDEQAAAKGKAYSERLLDKAFKRGKITEEKKAAHLGHIETTTDYDDLAGCEIVVEAVFESKEIKEKVLSAVEAAVAPDAIIASNTSTIPITELSAFLKDPSRFIGLHFFSPVEKMPLLEIISGEATSEATLAHAFDFCGAIKKTPIDVNDGRAFYTTRVVSSYMAEGMALVRDGVSPALIENAGKTMGMPMGPLRLADMVNLDLAVKIADQARADLGDAFNEPLGIAAARRMVALERVGEKARAGFYDYGGPQPILWRGLNEEFPLADEQPGLGAIQKRLMTIQVVETMRCFEDGVLKTPEDADLGSILGWGFPPFTGGIASYVDQTGAAALLSDARSLAEAHGARFEPPANLIALADANGLLHAA
ncbi:MAG: FAD-dependent oxidoreductase [Pseudomonadota bacterium]